MAAAFFHHHKRTFRRSITPRNKYKKHRGHGSLHYLNIELQGAFSKQSTIGIGTPKLSPSSTTDEEASFAVAAETTRHQVQKMRVPGRDTMDPFSRGMQAWEWIMCLSLLYVVFVVPAEVAFTNHRRNHEEQSILAVIDHVVWSLYVVDMVLRFFVWFKLPEGHWVRNHGMIVSYYIKGAFVWDLLSCFPVWFMYVGRSSRSTSSQKLHLLRLFKLLRLAKTFRVLRNTTLMRKFRYERDFSVVKVHLSFVLLFYVTASHWLACLWGYVGNHAASPKNSWMSTLVDFHANSKYNIKNPKVQYLYSLYFVTTTLTTVGYGDISPINLTERAVCIAVMVVGGLAWALIVATITRALTTLDIDKIRYNQLFDQVNWMLRDLDVTPATRAKARAYLINAISIHRRSNYVGLLKALGTGIQTQVCEEVFASRMCVVFFFRPLRKHVRLLLFQEFEHVLFSPGEEVQVFKTLVIINNSSGQIGYHGRYHYYGAPIFLDFLTSDNDPPDLAVSIHYTQARVSRCRYVTRPTVRLSVCLSQAATITRQAINRICQDNPIDTFPIVKARCFYALLKFSRALRLRRQNERFVSFGDNESITHSNRSNVLDAGFQPRNNIVYAPGSSFRRFTKLVDESLSEAPRNRDLESFVSAPSLGASYGAGGDIRAPSVRKRRASEPPLLERIDDDSHRSLEPHALSDVDSRDLVDYDYAREEKYNGDDDDDDDDKTPQRQAVEAFATAFKTFRATLADGDRTALDNLTAAT
ncbi:hypothetical protein CTAYLR_003047 [Chrysophaeum taylorii]|uniref:Ion transport domain-containing protein n=1 Tax=Chrysophaeum taylorii TaxID=2483200 RepID=A0AAD7U5C4_9STRA|nr:hypothetical protein CTAYLR_003047 [Chrysophaeum taylorii]